MIHDRLVYHVPHLQFTYSDWISLVVDLTFDRPVDPSAQAHLDTKGNGTVGRDLTGYQRVDVTQDLGDLGARRRRRTDPNSRVVATLLLDMVAPVIWQGVNRDILTL